MRFPSVRPIAQRPAFTKAVGTAGVTHIVPSLRPSVPPRRQTAGRAISQCGIPGFAYFFLVERALSHSIEALKS